VSAFLTQSEAANHGIAQRFTLWREGMLIEMFDAEAELENIRRIQDVRRRHRYARSQLDPFRAELVALRRLGASYAELAMWLKQKKRRKVAVSTVQRYLTKLPEFAQPSERGTGGRDGKA
jgi:hypothetical protein